MNITKTILILTIASTFLNAANKGKKEEVLLTNFQIEQEKGNYTGFIRKNAKVIEKKETYGVNAESLNNHKMIVTLIENGELKKAKELAFNVMTHVSKIPFVDPRKRVNEEQNKKAEENIETLEYALALVDMGEIEKYFGNYTKALKYHEKAFNMYNSLQPIILHSQIDNALSARYILDTFIKNDINKIIITEYLKRTIRTIDRTFGIDSEEKANIHIENAKNFYALSKFEEGDKEFIEIEKIFYKTPGYNSLKYAMIDIEKAYLYMNIGNFEDAERSFNKSINIVEKKLKKINENHFMLGEIYKNQALIYMGESKYHLAAEKYVKALNIFNVSIGIQNRTAAAIYNNLGIAYKNMNKNSESIDCFNRGLSINIKILGERTHEVATLYNNLASTYYKIGQKDECLKNLKLAYSINISLYGKGNKKTQTIAENIKLVQEEISVKDNALLKIIAPKVEINKVKQ